MKTKTSLGAWLASDGGTTYLLTFLGGGLLIIGSLLPWVNFKSNAAINEFIDTSASHTIGVGAWGGGAGIIAFIIGVLAIGGLIKTPFGIPQKLFLGTLGLGALLTVLAFIIDVNRDIVELNASGIWLALIGGGVLTFQLFLSMIKERTLNVGGSEHQISSCNLWNVGGLLLPALASTFAFPYLSELYSLDLSLGVSITSPTTTLLGGVDGIRTSPTLLDPSLRGTGVIVIVLLLVLFLLCLISIGSKKPPASFFLLFSFPVMAVSSTFLFRAFSAGVSFSRNGAGAGAWVILICSFIVVVIAFRSVRSGGACAIR